MEKHRPAREKRLRNSRTQQYLNEEYCSMALAWFRFYAELNDFLIPSRCQQRFSHTFSQRGSIKDMIEALGVPHTEVELILVNGVAVDFSYLVRDADRISVYPMFEALDITPLLRLRAHPLRVIQFIVDVNLGKLARYLRLLGFDTLYSNNYGDAVIAQLAASEHRIVLTRDRDLLKRRSITHGYFVRAAQPRQQLTEVVRRLDLYRTLLPLSRCSHCNARIERVEKEKIVAQIPVKTRQAVQCFWRCPGCGKLYWRGAHSTRIDQLIEALRQEQRLSPPDTAR